MLSKVHKNISTSVIYNKHWIFNGKLPTDLHKTVFIPKKRSCKLFLDCYCGIYLVAMDLKNHDLICAIWVADTWSSYHAMPFWRSENECLFLNLMNSQY